MSGNNANCSLVAQKEVEDMSFDKVVDIWLNADRYRASTSKEVNLSYIKTDSMESSKAKGKDKVKNSAKAVVCNFVQSGAELIVYETDKGTKGCAEVLANLPNVQTAEKSAEAVVNLSYIKTDSMESSETKGKAKVKRSAKAVVVKSNKKPTEGTKGCAEVLANLPNVQTAEISAEAVVNLSYIKTDSMESSKAKGKDKVKNSAKAVVVKSNKKPTEGTKGCAEVLANLPNVQTAEKSAEAVVNLSYIKTDSMESSETKGKDKVKRSAKAVVVKSNKKPTEDCKPKKGRNDKNKKKALKKEQPVVAMKCLGSQRTLIKMDVYKTIKWTSYSKATRQLLMALFPRKVLASHSLSGKQSPAFLNKPAKRSLDPDIISDIIETVCIECKVKENLVRHIITIKCADEAKMLRLREKKAKSRPRNSRTPKASRNG